jgi:hypothetical protein
VPSGPAATLLVAGVLAAMEFRRRPGRYAPDGRQLAAVRDDDLVEAVERITTFEVANDVAAVMQGGDSRHLAWHGYVTGGLPTVYEALGALLSEHGLAAFYADPRLEVFVLPEADVVVLGALRVPSFLSRSEWDARVASADDGNELAAGLMHDLAEAGPPRSSRAARGAAAQDPDPFVAARSPTLEMPAPGEVDFDLWRTDFIPPGTVMPPSHRFEDATGWRIPQ